MEIIRKVVPNNFNLFLVGDKHTGSKLSHDNGWGQMCDMVNSECDGIKPRNNFIIDHGDCIEAIDVHDKRFDFESTGSLRMSQILAQAQAAVIERQKVRKNLICILKGNHEQKVMRFGNVVKDIICDRLGVKYGTVSAVIQFIDRKGELLFKHYCHHGFGSIRSIAHPTKRRKVNKLISLMQKFDSKFGDCISASMGHTHQLLIAKPDPALYMTTDNEKIIQKYTSPKRTRGYIEPNHRWYINTGSFLKTFGMGFDGYAERAGYDPVQLGFALMKVRDRKIDDVLPVIVQ